MGCVKGRVTCPGLSASRQRGAREHVVQPRGLLSGTLLTSGASLGTCRPAVAPFRGRGPALLLLRLFLYLGPFSSRANEVHLGKAWPPHVHGPMGPQLRSRGPPGALQSTARKRWQKNLLFSGLTCSLPHLFLRSRVPRTAEASHP